MECIDTLVSHHPVLSDSIVRLTERGRERVKERAACEKARESERERQRESDRESEREKEGETSSVLSNSTRKKRGMEERESRTQE